MPRKPGFNPLVAQLSMPPVPAVQEWGLAYGGADGPLIDLAQAVPGYPAHADLLAWLAEAAGSAGLAGYGDIEGDMELRAAYARHVAALYGAPVEPANIHVTAGCNQAFAVAAMTVAGPGETVLLSNPCYFNQETTLQMMGIVPRYVECRAGNGFLPAAQDIAAAIEAAPVAALGLVSPNNPTGAIYPPELLAEIFRLCREKGVWLILDETYRDFLPADAGAPHGLFSLPGWQDNLIQIYSFSKAFCIPGHRLGAIMAGQEAVVQMAKVMDNLQICAPRAPQQAVARGLDALAAWREGNRVEIERRAAAMKAAFAQLDGWRIEAMGAYFAFVKHPFPAMSAVQVAQRLARQCGILTIPGSYFGSGLEAYLRVAFANVDAEQIHAAGSRLRMFETEPAAP